MQELFFIKKIAILGAGVMGAQIAAHCVNAGIQTLLFDLTTQGSDPNALVKKAIGNLHKLKPNPLAAADTSTYLRACNYEQDITALVDCDLVIEAIAERLDWKEKLYKRITPYLNKRSILVSNTSGLSINTLAEVLPEPLRARFCGVHFFNPPRYMHLAELIPAQSTEPALLDYLETWLTRYLGKGVIRAKDTPNFIANRIGVFSLLVTMHHAEAMGLGFDEVDALTGGLLGRPKSATFRTMDVVGLDTMLHVVHTMREQLREDPWYACFHLPEWLTSLIEAGNLGQKTGQGVYRKNGKAIEVYDPKLKNYRTAQAVIDNDLMTIMKNTNLHLRMELLAASPNKQAKFLTAYYRDLFHYCAFHLESIANNVRDVDLAMRWGFGWQEGPFETWQKAGLAEMRVLIQNSIAAGHTLSQAKLPHWVEKNIDFYTEKGAFSPSASSFQGRSNLAVYQRQFLPDQVLKEPRHQLTILYQNEGVHLWHLKDDVAVVSFKTKANTVDQSVLDGLEEAIARAEERCRGLIIYQDDANNFSAGADLRGVAMLIKENKLAALEAMVSQFQRVAMHLKYSTIPTVAALRGRALGGGCELIMHCSAVVAAFEACPGLVEVGAGLIPAGGGCKEMAIRAAKRVEGIDLMQFLQIYFQNIATATVASSAPDAIQKGFLREQDQWVMHSNEVLYAALAKVNALQAMNYLPPLKPQFKIAGIEGQAHLQVGLVNWREGGFISEHDYFIAEQLGRVICGGELNQGELVDEDWILALERQAFIALAATPLTQARIAHLLETGKPLRN